MRSVLIAALLLGSLPVAAQPEKNQTMAVPEYLVPDKLPEPLRAHLEAGRFAEAEAWIDVSTASYRDPRLLRERERLVRLRRDFSLTAEALLEKITEKIPDAGLHDLEQWRSEGALQFLEIDGDIRYFRREPANLWRRSENARARRDKADQAAAASAPAGDPAQAAGTFTLEQHIAEALTAAGDADTTQVLATTFRVRHTITVKPDRVRPGTTIRCWMPLPQEYRQQTAPEDLATTPTVVHVGGTGGIHRTLYLEQPAAPKGQPTVFEASYTYSSAAFVTRLDPALARPVNPADPELAPFLGEQLPHIALTPEVRALAREIVGAETNPLRKAELIFRWIDANILYVSEMEYCVMPSIIEKIMAERAGDCGVHVILFVALCRAEGVPARWQSGWVTRPGHWNMHDWAEFHVAPWGWLPADPSMGLRKSREARVRDFYFGSTDSYRMIANFGIDGAFDPPKKHWRSDPVDSQRGEVETDAGNLYYDDWQYDVRVESEPSDKGD